MNKDSKNKNLSTVINQSEIHSAIQQLNEGLLDYKLSKRIENDHYNAYQNLTEVMDLFRKAQDRLNALIEAAEMWEMKD